MPQCSKCQNVKDESEFSFKGGRNRVLWDICKKCKYESYMVLPYSFKYADASGIEIPTNFQSKVYLAQSSLGFYKIGSSVNPKQRMSFMGSTHKGFGKFTLLHIIQTNVKYLDCLLIAERTLQFFFLDKHRGRELFDLNPEDVARIQSIVYIEVEYLKDRRYSCVFYGEGVECQEPQKVNC